MLEKRIIKRYNNRKLYDTELCRYITLPELVKTMKSGVEVVVIDKSTGDDLTRRTLVQALHERELTNPKFSLENIKDMLK